MAEPLNGIFIGVVGIGEFLLSDVTQKSGLRAGAKDTCWALRSLFLWIPALLLFGFAGHSTAQAANVQSDPVTTSGPAPQFAIADFDGDVRPDLASIQTGSNSSGTTTDYWIQLQLSAAGRQSIRVIGPVGGLWIEARDVNGDHAVDLVLTTAWFRRPVAILLNDGHGSFSQVEPSAFPEAFRETTQQWALNLEHATGAVGIPPQPRAGVCPETTSLFGVESDALPILLPSPSFASASFLISHAGRAPPSEVSHS